MVGVMKIMKFEGPKVTLQAHFFETKNINQKKDQNNRVLEKYLSQYLIGLQLN